MANEIIIQSNQPVAVFGEAELGTTYSSFSPEDMEGKIKLYNSINAPAAKIGDCINQTIHVVDVVVCAVKLAGTRTDKTGKDLPEDQQTPDKDAFRVILIDKDGLAYAATSAGIYNSVSTIRKVFGDLHFDTPLPVIVRQISTKNGSTLTLQIAT